MSVLSNPEETFTRFCKRAGLGMLGERKLAPRYNWQHYASVQLAENENLLAIYWSEELAKKYGIRSVRGYLATDHGRIVAVENRGDGFVGCVQQLLGPVGRLQREALLKVTEPLGSFNDKTVERMELAIGNLQKARDADLLAREPNLTLVAGEAQGFAGACNELSLAHVAEKWLPLSRAMGSVAETLLLLSGARNTLFTNEQPLLRIVRPGPKHLIVTNFGRLVWCQACPRACCLDAPFGDKLSDPGLREKILGAAETHFASEGWEGVETFCRDLYSMTAKWS